MKRQTGQAEETRHLWIMIPPNNVLSVPFSASLRARPFIETRIRSYFVYKETTKFIYICISLMGILKVCL